MTASPYVRQFTIRPEKGLTVFVFDKYLDDPPHEQDHPVFDAPIQSGHVVCDLTGTRLVPPDWIRFLGRCNIWANQAGHRLHLAVNDHTKTLVEYMGQEKHLRLFPSVEEARRALP